MDANFRSENQSVAPAREPAAAVPGPLVLASKHRLDPVRAASVRMAPPAVMDLKEASAYLVCSPRKLRDLIASGRIKSARVGAKIVIRRQWLDAFLGA